MSDQEAWPDLAALDLGPTIETLHLWSQVAGKVRLTLTPWENHSWHVPLYVSARGLVTGLIPSGAAAFTIEFDFVADLMLIRSSDGSGAEVPLEPKSVAAFYEEVISGLAGLGISPRIHTMPAEIANAVPFEKDLSPRAFDPQTARAYWRALVQIHRVFQVFRTRFVGKCSPIHLFWGAFDLAVTRFSGRSAPRHPGGAPHMPNAVAREAYSREVSSAGFWPNLGSPQGPCFYSYAYPAPEGFAERPIRPSAAFFDKSFGEFLLPYAAVRGSGDPDAALMEFLQSTYEAAAELGGWNRADLECAGGALGRPPPGS